MSLHQSIRARLRSIERDVRQDDQGDRESPVSPEVERAMLEAGKAWAGANGIKAREWENWPDDEPIPAGMAEAMIAAGLEASKAETGPR